MDKCLGTVYRLKNARWKVEKNDRTQKHKRWVKIRDFGYFELNLYIVNEKFSKFPNLITLFYLLFLSLQVCKLSFVSTAVTTWNEDPFKVILLKIIERIADAL